MASFKHCLNVALAVAACVSSNAKAQSVSGVITVGDIGFTLTDLDLTDGITPQLTWTYGWTQNHLQVFDQHTPGPPKATGLIYQGVFSMLQRPEGKFGEPTDTAFRDYRIRSDQSSATFSLVNPPGTSTRMDIDQYGAFTLTPNTMVSFSATLSGTLSGTDPDRPLSELYPYGEGAHYDWSYADANISSFILVENLDVLADDEDEVNQSIQTDQTHHDVQATMNEPMKVSFANRTDSRLHGALWLGTTLRAHTIDPSFVPEPSALIQCMAGVGILCTFALHRRRS